ncbi:MAG: SH3 domain-containing protein [Bacteroidales bacterium]|nr:SH3 domain-containing protein [Bacteroidales bacterium]
MKKGHIIAIVVVAIVLIGAVVAYFLLSGKDNGKSKGKGNKNKYIVSTAETGLNVRVEPDVTAEKIASLDRGTEVEIVEVKNNFGRLSSGGWVSMDYLTKA